MDVLRCAADESDHSRQILCKWWFVRNPETAIKLSSAPEIRQEIPYDGLDLAKLNYVVVVGGLLRDANKIYPQAYQFLNTAHKAGVSVVAICAGFFHLARWSSRWQALCGHWAYERRLELEYPDVIPVLGQAYVQDGQIITALGGIAEETGHENALTGFALSHLLLRTAPSTLWNMNSM